MKTKSLHISRSLLAAGAVAVAMLATSGRLTAAAPAGPESAGPNDIDSALVSQHTRTETQIRLEDRPDLMSRADNARDGLSLPVGATRSARHVHDGFLATEYDEVAELDGAGQPVSMTQFDGTGTLMVAVRFDNPVAVAVRTTRDAAIGSAKRALTRTGLAVAGQPTVDSAADAAGWYVHWDRRQDGLVVRGDEVRVRVWPDGGIQSVARVEHRLDAAPSQRLSQTQATGAITKLVSAWSAGNGASYSLQTLDMQWVGPNAAFDPAKLTAAPSPYRLAWVACLKPMGAVADYVGLITVYLDAGDGTVIGGDFVE